jgi:hypothetical protein
MFPSAVGRNSSGDRTGTWSSEKNARLSTKLSRAITALYFFLCARSVNNRRERKVHIFISPNECRVIGSRLYAPGNDKLALAVRSIVISTCFTINRPLIKFIARASERNASGFQLTLQTRSK